MESTAASSAAGINAAAAAGINAAATWVIKAVKGDDMLNIESWLGLAGPLSGAHCKAQSKRTPPFALHLASVTLIDSADWHIVA